jgi:hypothetical protein
MPTNSYLQMDILKSNDIDEMYYYYKQRIDSDEFINNQIIIVNTMLRLSTNQEHLNKIFLLSSYVRQPIPKRIHIII